MVFTGGVTSAAVEPVPVKLTVCVVALVEVMLTAPGLAVVVVGAKFTYTNGLVAAFTSAGVKLIEVLKVIPSLDTAYGAEVLTVAFALNIPDKEKLCAVEVVPVVWLVPKSREVTDGVTNAAAVGDAVL